MRILPNWLNCYATSLGAEYFRIAEFVFGHLKASSPKLYYFLRCEFIS